MFMTAKPASKLLGGAYIYGPVGCGKTQAACGAIRAFVERRVRTVEGHEFYRGKKARFVNTPEWFMEIRDTYGRRGASEAEVFRWYSTCGLLVLDDIGKGKQSDWATEKLYILLNHRWENNLPTIITSNYELGELVSILTADDKSRDAIYSRIGGMCKPYQFSGPDMRVGQF